MPLHRRVLWKGISETTLEKNLTNVICVTEHLRMDVIWNAILRESTLVKNHTSAVYAIKNLYRRVNWIVIQELTLERSHTFAYYVMELFHTVVISEAT
jgi:hypothetical protein